MFLNSATPDFLLRLAGHNNRDWFDAHRDDYEAARKDFAQYVAAVQRAMLPFLPELQDQPLGDAIFRIFRDVRFSKDKTPYKTNFSAYFSRGGRKWPGAGYYLQFQPGASFLAAGMWQPDPPVLKKVRQEIDYNTEEWESIVSGGPFRKAFGGMRGEALKKLPAGYAADHPAINYLRHKSFYFLSPLPDALFHDPKGVAKIAGLFRKLEPVVAFLNRAMED